jgi:Holliday junction resolvasome RuvABC endonuclease subunit
MRFPSTPALVLGLHPASRGFGWAVFDGPARPVDWGITYLREDPGAGYRQRIRLLIERHRPEVIAVEAPSGALKAPSAGSRALLEAVVALAEEYGVELHRYGRPEVRRALLLDARASRDRIAEAVAASVAALSHRLPPPRKPWDAQKRPVSLFSAAALILTYYASDEEEPDAHFEPCG